MKALVLCLVLLGASLAHAGDTPDSADAKAYFADGIGAFERGDYAAASRAFAAGYEIEKWNGFLFAWAQSERKAGNCEKAVQLYSRFIATKPEGDAAEHAHGWIKQCGGTYVEPPKEPQQDPIKEPPKDPIEEPPKDPVKEPSKPVPSAPGFQHKLALGLGIAALAAGGVATWGFVRSGKDFDSAEDLIDYKDVAARRDRAESRLLIAQVSLGVGIGLATASVLRFVLHRPAKTELVPTTNGVAIRGRF